MKASVRRAVFLACLVGVLTTGLAQFRGRRRGGYGGGPLDRGNVPTWPIDEGFAGETFTFARIQYRSTGWERSSYAWWTDFPDADLNLSYRLQQLTALKVNPDPKVLEITDPNLFNHPWVFMSGAGNIILNNDEALLLRKYLLNGGFLMVDDFWGQAEWDGVMNALNQALPGRKFEDLPRTHRLFHC